MTRPSSGTTCCTYPLPTARQPGTELALVEDKDPVVYVAERQKRGIVEAVGRLMPSTEALQRTRSGQFTYVAKRGALASS